MTCGVAVYDVWGGSVGLVGWQCGTCGGGSVGLVGWQCMTCGWQCGTFEVAVWEL